MARRVKTAGREPRVDRAAWADAIEARYLVPRTHPDLRAHYQWKVDKIRAGELVAATAIEMRWAGVWVPVYTHFDVDPDGLFTPGIRSTPDGRSVVDEESAAWFANEYKR